MAANSAIVPSPRIAAKATLALKSGEKLRRFAIVVRSSQLRKFHLTTLSEIWGPLLRDTFTTPVTVLDAAEIAAVGGTNIGEYLSKIPQTISEINSSTNVFSNNSSALQNTALRNLGAERTLVLVNGKRFVSGQSPGDGYAVDLNSIPVPLIERVEIKTGGTSAIYGSDANAGVVTFILKDDFEGVEVNVQGSTPADGDRGRFDASLTMGTNFDRGNGWVSVGWSEDDGLTALDRSFSQEDLAYYTRPGLDDIGQTGLAPGDHWLGSSFPPGGRLSTDDNDYFGDGTPWRSGLGRPCKFRPVQSRQFP